MPPRRLLLILAAGLTLRLTLLALGPAHDIARAQLPDSPLYIRLAQNLITYGSFGKLREEPGTIYEPIQQLRAKLGQLEPRDGRGLLPETMRTPGYPLLIAAVLRAGLPLAGVLVLQCLLGAASILLVYALGRSLFNDHRAALIAAAIVALNPADIVSANMLLSETLFTFLMLAGLVLAAQARERDNGLPGYTAAGSLIGLSVLVRPVAMYLGPAIALWMVATDRRARSFGAAGLLLAASFIPVGAWCARNADAGLGYRLTYVASLQVFSKTVPFMEMKARGLNNYPADWMACYHEQLDRLAAQIHPGEDVYDAMSRISRRQILDQPTLYARVLADNAGKFFLDHSVSDVYGLVGLTYHPSGLGDAAFGRGAARAGALDPIAIASALLWSGMNLILALLTLIGLVQLLRRRQWSALLLLAGLMFYFLAATQAHGLERMRLPVLGVQALLCAAGVVGRRGAKASAYASDSMPIISARSLRKAA